MTESNSGGLEPEQAASTPNMTRALGTSVGLVMVALALSRLSGVIRDVLVAGLFGASHAADSFVAAFTLPDLLTTLILAGLISVVAIPVLAAGNPPADRWRLTNALITTLVLIATGVTLLLVAAAQPLLEVLVPGLNGADRAHAATMLRIMAPAIIFFAAGGGVTAALNMSGRFMVPALVGTAVNFSVIAAAAVFSRSVGVDALAYGFLIGSIAQCAIQIPPLFALGYRPRVVLWDRRLSVVYAAMLPLLLVILLQYGRLVVERSFGSSGPEGSLAVLNFANRVLAVAPALVVAPVSTVLYPLISRHETRRDGAAAADLVVSGVRMILLVVLPLAAVTVALARPLVAALYQRGAFEAGATETTAALVQVFALALAPLCVNEFVTRTYFASGRGRFALIATGAGFAITAMVDFLVFRPLGLNGLGLGAGAGAWTVLVIFVLDKELWRRRDLVKTAGVGLLAGVTAAVGGLALFSELAAAPSALRTAGAMGCAAATYIAVVLVLRRRELVFVAEVARRHTDHTA